MIAGKKNDDIRITLTAISRHKRDEQLITVPLTTSLALGSRKKRETLRTPVANIGRGAEGIQFALLHYNFKN